MKISADDQKFLDDLRSMNPSEVLKCVGTLFNENDLHKIELMFKHEVRFYGGDALLSRRALGAGNLEMFKMLVQYGASLDDCDFVAKPDWRTRDLYNLVASFQAVREAVEKHPERYDFVPKYRAEILLNGIVSPPYSNIKVPMVIWALCMQPPDVVFTKLSEHLELDDEITKDLTYRMALTQLGLYDDYNEFVLMNTLEKQLKKNSPAPLKRSPRTGGFKR